MQLLQLQNNENIQLIVISNVQQEHLGCQKVQGQEEPGLKALTLQGHQKQFWIGLAEAIAKELGR